MTNMCTHRIIHYNSSPSLTPTSIHSNIYIHINEEKVIWYQLELGK